MQAKVRDIQEGRRSTIKRAKARGLQTSAREGRRSSAKVRKFQQGRRSSNKSVKVRGLLTSASEGWRSSAKVRGVQQRFEMFNKVGGVQTSVQRPEEFQTSARKSQRSSARVRQFQQGRRSSYRSEKARGFLQAYAKARGAQTKVNCKASEALLKCPKMTCPTLPRAACKLFDRAELKIRGEKLGVTTYLVVIPNF